MDDNEKKKVLALYPEFNRVYGPYQGTDGRKRVVLFDGTRRSSRQLAKVRLEAHIGRRLVGDEEVDHMDEDPSNDAIDNLGIQTGYINRSKWHSHSGRDIRSHHPQFCEICETPFYSVKAKRTCSPPCKAVLHSRISLALGLIPPPYKRS